MIKAALQYIVGLAQEPVEIGDHFYHKDKLQVVNPPTIEPIQISTMDGFIAFCKAIKSKKDVFICLMDKEIAVVSRNLQNGYLRNTYAKVPVPIEEPAVSALIKARDRFAQEIKDIEVYI